MVGLRNPVFVGMILHREVSVPALGCAPHGLDLSLQGPLRCWSVSWGTITDSPFGVPDSPLKEISTQLIGGTSSILGDS